MFTNSLFNPFGLNQQNNHQNNNNQANNDQKNNTPSKTIAIGPAREDEMQEIINTLQMQLLIRNQKNIVLKNLKPEYTQLPDYNFFTIMMQPNIFYQLLRFSSVSFRNTRLMLSPSVAPHMISKYAEIIEDIFPQCITKNFLDLSNLKEKSRSFHADDINYSEGGLPFLLFLIALRCYDMQYNIEQISFDYNSLQNPLNLKYFPQFFPQLRHLSVSGNRFNDQPPKKRNLKPNEKEKDPKEELKEQLSNLSRKSIHCDLDIPLDKSYYTGTQKKRKAKYIEQPPPPRVTQPLPVYVPSLAPDEERMHNLEELYKPLCILSYEFPTNEFIKSFFKTSKESLSTTSPFYDQDAIFSISVDACPPNSPMNYFTQFSTNRYKAETLNFHQICGKDCVVSGLQQLFGYRLDAVIIQLHQMQLNKQRFSIVTHGFLRCDILESAIFAFDRSFLVIKKKSDEYVILNDHIFIRNSRNIPREV